MEANFSTSAFSGAPVRILELQYIVDCIRQGHCCSLVGPSNTGKSFLLRSLTSEEVRQRCTRQGFNPPVIVFIDCLEAGDSEHAFYELLLRRTIEELEVASVPASAIDNLRDLHSKMLGDIADIAVRSLYASGVRQLGQETDIPLVLILDEFYDVFRHLPPWPFRQLRALYNALGTKVCYITGTSHHLEQLRPDKDTYEFRELFHLHTLILNPLNQADARHFVTFLAKKRGVALSDENISLMAELSGGHPGILERIYIMLSERKDNLMKPLSITAPELIRERPIQKECERLWSELEAEHEALLTLVERDERALTIDKKRLLEAKGLVVSKKGQSLVIFSPVFETFIREEIVGDSQSVIQGLRCDFETGQIWVDGQEVTLQLSEPQRKLVNFLYQKAGMVCTYDDIAEGVWGVGEGVSPGAIYELVKRVRQKIEPDWKTPRYIVTVPGKGYRLQGLR